MSNSMFLDLGDYSTTSMNIIFPNHSTGKVFTPVGKKKPTTACSLKRLHGVSVGDFVVEVKCIAINYFDT